MLSIDRAEQAAIIVWRKTYQQVAAQHWACLTFLVIRSFTRFWNHCWLATGALAGQRQRALIATEGHQEDAVVAGRTTKKVQPKATAQQQLTAAKQSKAKAGQ